jgi:CubicO group peptidase (beta-lactamase class C family)
MTIPKAIESRNYSYPRGYTDPMRRGACLVLGLIAAGVSPTGESIAWRSITPREAGLDASALDAWRNALAGRSTTGLLVIRRGAIAFEWYADGWNADRPHGTASMAKALVGGTSLLVAMSDGRISADDLASNYIPGWKDDPRKAKITIRQLATHTSGIEDAEEGEMAHDQLRGWKGAFWKRTPDPFSIAVRQAPIVFEPGTSNEYSNPGMAALAYAVTASLHGEDIRTLLESRVLRPLGIAQSAWSIGYGRGYEVDGLTLWATWGGGSFTARAAARVGQWMMLGGAWAGRQLVRKDAVKLATTYAGMPKPARNEDPFAPGSGLAWYTNADGVWPDVPRDAIAGAGAGHQVVVAIPSLDLVVVRNGDALGERTGPFWTPVYGEILRPLMAAVTVRGPYAPSPVIRRVTFGAEVLRAAVDSDNWPITWGADDTQYTSYGDGFGFEPFVERKLGMGFARITGGANAFRGENLRSAGERVGNGAHSPKASGILMVDGGLYLWVRNVGNAELWRSKDRGKTWEQGFRMETSFGSPTFLNFGRDYRGARDGYVYTYSQDGPSAYESDNQLLLARAPKGRLMDRAAWEFLQKVDGGGRPVWTRDIALRGAAFVCPGCVQRSDVVYNAGLGRYLLALAYNHEGGWGLFDAPEPWGPWTQAPGIEEGWNIAGTHGYRLPAKWIAADGLTMMLVFSGVKPNDAFCTKELRIERR